MYIVIFSCCCALTKCNVEDKEVKQKRRLKPYRPSARRIYPGQYRALTYPRLPKKKPISGVASSITAVSTDSETMKVKALRGGEFIGNRMRFKVKVVNDSQYTITDVRVYLLSFPKAALRLAGEDDCLFSKVEPGGFRSPTFDFLPTQDCVQGNIVAGVSYVDMRGKAHTFSTKPFVIRSVCDLLLPDQVTPEDFELKLRSHEHGEIAIKVNEWTPREMYDKALRLIDESNFFEVGSNIEEIEGVVYAKISGLARGKYTGKSLGVQISINGPAGEKGASCMIKVSGEDQAMILPAIDDLRERINAWLCPMCGSALTLEIVADLREGKVVQCPFCGVTIGR